MKTVFLEGDLILLKVYQFTINPISPSELFLNLSKKLIISHQAISQNIKLNQNDHLIQITIIIEP